MDKNGHISQNTLDMLNDLKDTYFEHENLVHELSFDTKLLLEKFASTIDHLFSELLDFETELQNSYNTHFDDLIDFATTAEVKIREEKSRFRKRNQNAGKAIINKFSYTFDLAKQECEKFFQQYPSRLKKMQLLRGDLSAIRKEMVRHFDAAAYYEKTQAIEEPTSKTFENNIKRVLKEFWPDIYKNSYTNNK